MTDAIKRKLEPCYSVLSMLFERNRAPSMQVNGEDFTEHKALAIALTATGDLLARITTLEAENAAKDDLIDAIRAATQNLLDAGGADLHDDRCENTGMDDPPTVCHRACPSAIARLAVALPPPTGKVPVDLEKLREIEWHDNDWPEGCPVCNGMRVTGHADDCWLAALLKD